MSNRFQEVNEVNIYVEKRKMCEMIKERNSEMTLEMVSVVGDRVMLWDSAVGPRLPSAYEMICMIIKRDIAAHTSTCKVCCMHEGKITVTIYPTSKQNFCSCGIYGDYVLVNLIEEHVKQDTHICLNSISRD